MDRRFYGVDWRYVDKEWSGVEGISEFCETVKGDFFTSFHMGALMVRWLGDSDGSESRKLLFDDFKSFLYFCVFYSKEHE